MITNNRYDIQLAGDYLPQPLSIEKISGVSSVRYNNSILSLTIGEKHADDAAEILQEVVSLIRREGGKVLTEKISQPVLNMTCAACASSSQNILSYVPGRHEELFTGDRIRPASRRGGILVCTGGGNREGELQEAAPAYHLVHFSCHSPGDRRHVFHACSLRQ